MKAVTYQGAKSVKVSEVPDAKLEQADDVLVRITTTAICGTDLHLYNGHLPGTPHGYVIGHEPVGIVEETGPEVTRVKKGDRVIIPATVACGGCRYCRSDLESLCDNGNPNANAFGEPGGVLGYSEKYGGFAGAQAELLRVPYGNFMPFPVPPESELSDESLLFLSDILPTAYWSVENAGVMPGDTVVVLGCGPVGLLTQKCAKLKGAARIIAVDHVPYRLEHARATNGVETFNFDETDNLEEHIKEITRGGADVVIDCVGMDGQKSVLEKVETALKLQGGTLGPLRMAIHMVRKGGTVQLTGFYGMLYHAFPLGYMFERNITLRMGSVPLVHYMPELYHLMRTGALDPADVITHRLPLDEGERAYDLFAGKKDGAIKVLLKP
ncbi:zinc-dependent alcohol dehydrogenase [Paenibacillus mucilaginosus]|uniref:AdhB2 n=1 Tax=Paenibacillus mucilaginosus (strain KNP414) TaxID=1036673 RepID=F8FI50_PAEMK|nr:zinc-dependent alcohol dehydrogenase [Paenibacillus mucilaginosus]AEI43953.1 AdhB2 [Paenibacillus mucilaginosus KNP414]MCG7212549.1 glutathione-dependent formaldehyde dehydrogenase [Paenibacillus mucilaginosus]WDM25422.1 glutathione-dependent formaldehyde dehydrogenase [Paenibacillus mucilaginosus]